MGPYGSVGAHIKTGRSPMAQDYFKTPPDPQKGNEMTKHPQKKKNLLEFAKIPCQQRGFPCGSISSLGALGGAWIWI